jgi:quercetin dioxygenase-like cupin family protein
MSKDLAEFPGKEGTMITVKYPPGGSDPSVHRHNAYAFLYVLAGSVVMQVKGGKEATLTPGQTFYEAPIDKGAKEIYYRGAPHGLTATHADQVNADLLEFVRSVREGRRAA